MALEAVVLHLRIMNVLLPDENPACQLCRACGSSMAANARSLTDRQMFEESAKIVMSTPCENTEGAKATAVATATEAEQDGGDSSRGAP